MPFTLLLLHGAVDAFKLIQPVADNGGVGGVIIGPLPLLMLVNSSYELSFPMLLADDTLTIGKAVAAVVVVVAPAALDDVTPVDLTSETLATLDEAPVDDDVN